MPGHESTAVVVVNLQLDERTLAHKVLGIKFPSGSLMRKTWICSTPAVTAYIIQYICMSLLLHEGIVTVLEFMVKLQVNIDFMP